jgi:formylglycine-generating enzyme required for sulfatase activity
MASSIGIVLFFSLAIPATAQINPNVPKPAPKPRPAAAPAASGPKQFTGNSSILVVVDADGVLSVDYEKIGNFRAGETWKSPIMAGSHVVELRMGADRWEHTVECMSGQQLIEKTELAKVRAARQSSALGDTVAEPNTLTGTELQAAEEAVERRRRDPFDAYMVRIEGGGYMMGCTSEQGSECGEDGKPAHWVEVSTFWVSKYEVTVGEFRQFVAASGHVTTAERDGDSFVWTGEKYEVRTGVDWRCDAEGRRWGTEGDRHPVVHVSWDDAVAFARWAGQMSGQAYRLPTEAEWEYAARGGQQSQGGRYGWGLGSPSGNVADLSAKRRLTGLPILEGYDDGFVYSAPVGSFRANELGLYDMSGNVSEWCQDWYGKSYYSSSPQRDPQGPSSGQNRVVRGGSWGEIPCWVALRIFWFAPYSRFCNTGFRLARTE